MKTFESFGYLYAGRNEEAARSSEEIIASDLGSSQNIWPYVIEISALVRLGRSDEVRAKVDQFHTRLGDLDWPAIERGAWSQEELDQVAADMQSAGMIER
jgi:hypothetical protein